MTFVTKAEYMIARVQLQQWTQSKIVLVDLIRRQRNVLSKDIRGTAGQWHRLLSSRALGLRFWCLCLNNFLTKGPIFSFCTGVPENYGWLVQLKVKMEMTFQKWKMTLKKGNSTWNDGIFSKKIFINSQSIP